MPWGCFASQFCFFYIKGELAYDQFHANKDEIYRVIRLSEMNGEQYKIGVTSGPYAPHLALDFPVDIKSTLRIFSTEALFEYEDKVFKEDKLLFADPNFFDFFSFPLAVGDPKTVLEQPNALVLTKAAVKKYFGNENPLGKRWFWTKKTLCGDWCNGRLASGFSFGFRIYGFYEVHRRFQFYEGLVEQWPFYLCTSRVTFNCGWT